MALTQQNMHAKGSMTDKTTLSSLNSRESFATLERLHNNFDGGFKIEYVREQNNQVLNYTINNTMMRVDPPTPIKPGGKLVLENQMVVQYEQLNEIWRKNDREVSKVFCFAIEVTGVVLDPFHEVADVDRNNNYWPQRMIPSRFELFKQRFGTSGENAM